MSTTQLSSPKNTNVSAPRVAIDRFCCRYFRIAGQLVIYNFSSISVLVFSPKSSNPAFRHSRVSSSDVQDAVMIPLDNESEQTILPWLPKHRLYFLNDAQVGNRDNNVRISVRWFKLVISATYWHYMSSGYYLRSLFCLVGAAHIRSSLQVANVITEE